MQASARVVEALDVPTTGAASARAGRPIVAPPRPRVPQRAIEVIGVVLGIAFIASVARAHDLSNDEFWSLAAGQWMLAHHAFMGLDPFSYTESQHRWVTDEWGSEIALAALFRAFGAAAYGLYAIVLGGASLVASAAYARALGARGGRVVAIVLLLALGLAGVVAADRGLDFSLVWLPLELLILTKGRANPRWLLLLPVLCLFWVNTHGSILLGLFVLGVELGWSLIPERFARRLGGLRQSSHTGPLALALLGSLVASCVTPYGPGLLAYDFGVARNGQIAVHRRVELTRLPFRDDAARLLCAAGGARDLRLAPADPLARGHAGPAALRGGTAVAAVRRLSHGGCRRRGRDPPGAAAVGRHGPALGGGGPGGHRHRDPGDTRGPGRDGGVVAAGAGFRLSRARTRDASSLRTPGATTRSPATGRPSSTGARTCSRVVCCRSSWPCPP